MAAHVEILIGQRFEVLSSIVWHKPDAATGMTSKKALRSWAPVSERLLFAEQKNADSMALGDIGWAAQCEQLRGFVFEPLRAYFDGERKRAGIDKSDVNAACGFKRIPGGMASRHYFGRSQWCIPTAQHYAVMRDMFNRDGRRPAPPFLDFHDPAALRFHVGHDEFLRADYESLRADYESLRADYESLRADYESLRRPFSVSPDVQWGDVWRFNKQPAGRGEKRHPCEKPQALISHIITASTRPGAVILDPFSGSGAIGEAALRLGRSYLGAELDPLWAGRAHDRLARVSAEVAPGVALAAE